MADIPVKDEVSGVVQTAPNPTPPIMQAQGDPQPQRYIVNGKEVTVTPDQYTALIQKGLAADEKFREASELRKEAERAIATQEDLKQIILDGDVDAFRRMGANLGIPGDEIETEIQRLFGDEDEEEEEEDQLQTRGQAPPQDRKLELNDFPLDVQRIMLQAERQRIDGIVVKALDKSEKVRYNMEQFDEKGRQAIRDLVDEKIRGRLAATNGDFGDGTYILRDIIPEVERILEAIGSPTRRVAPLGVGPSPGGDGLEVYPTKLPDHVPSTDGGFEQNVLETLAYHHANAQRASR